MITLRIADPELADAVERLSSLCGPVGADVTVWDEDSAASASASELNCSAVVLYRKRAYLYSDTHIRLSRGLGGRYTAVSLPLNYGELCGALYHSAVSCCTSAVTDGGAAEPRASERLRISEEDGTVTCGSLSVKLTEREMALLVCLRDNVGTTMSRERLKELVWHDCTEDGTNIVDVYISYLRRKLRPLLGDGAIISIRSRGYKMELPAD